MSRGHWKRCSPCSPPEYSVCGPRRGSCVVGSHLPQTCARDLSRELPGSRELGCRGGRDLQPRPERCLSLGTPAHTPAPTGEQDGAPPEHPQHVAATSGALHQVPGESEGQALRRLQRDLERME